MNSKSILNPFLTCALSLLVAVIVMSCNERLVYLEESRFVLEPPFVEPAAAIFTAEQTVWLKTEIPDAEIRYTLDGSKPNVNSNLYADSLHFTKTSHIRAITVKEGYNDSPIVEGYYSLSTCEMVFVEGSEFDMADDLSIIVSDFFIGKYEVTQAEFAAVMGFNPSHFKGKSDHPVENVTWFDAVEFSNRLSIAEGLAPCYSYGGYGTDPDDWPYNWNINYQNARRISCNFNADGYRLPTLFERLYASFGGKKALQQGTFFNHYGVINDSAKIGDYAWYSGNSNTGEGRSTQPVGLKKPNELGLYDMIGNVENWCWDGYVRGMFDIKGTHKDPVFAKNSYYRLFAGGNFISAGNTLKVDRFGATLAEEKVSQMGIRLARRLHN